MGSPASDVRSVAEKLLQKLTLSDLLSIVSIFLANKNKLANILCCIENCKIVCSGTLEGELVISDQNLCQVAQKLANPCKK